MKRAVMFVYNDCRNDARVLREAATLVGAGYEVTIMARPTSTASQEVEREQRDGFEIVRIPIPRRTSSRTWVWVRQTWRTKGWIARWVFFRVKRAILHPRPRTWWQALIAVVFGLIMLPWAILQRLTWVVLRLFGRERLPGSVTVDWLVRWRQTILGWANACAAAAPMADVYHGHDLTALPAALAAARRNGAPVIYDSHEIFLEAGATATRPRWARWIFKRLEQGWIRRSAALVTVNRSLEEILTARYHPRRTVVLHNTPSRWTAPSPPRHLMRTELGLGPDDPIALYHGGFSAHRGLEELAAAILEPGLERVHAVFLGYGSRKDWLLEQAADPRYGGRLHVLAAVPPERLLEWVVDADVGVMAIQTSTLNHYLSTPNKLFECLSAGVPVVASDFPEIRRIVAGDAAGPLGILCRPDDPADVARGIRSILDLSAGERLALRLRCLTAAHERWNWETESAHLIDLYAQLTAASTASSTAALTAAS
jgi:glycosyltransferase involved in cell wall biosynthesis